MLIGQLPWLPYQYDIKKDPCQGVCDAQCAVAQAATADLRKDTMLLAVMLNRPVNSRTDNAPSKPVHPHEVEVSGIEPESETPEDTSSWSLPIL